MFDWIPNLLITLGLGYLLIGVVCLILGFGLARMSDKEVPKPDGDCEERAELERHRERRARAERLLGTSPQTDDDAVARRLLNY